MSRDPHTDSDRDQSTSDADQVAADSEQAASDRDQALAGADQRASDRDQAASDRELDASPAVGAALQRAHDVSQAEREDSTADRIATAAIRAQIAAERFDWADFRDHNSQLRDLAAEARDDAANTRDRLAGQGELGPAATARTQAAADRARAAADRDRAAVDRKQAATDREHARAALADAHLDELTGTFRRGMGNHELQNEIDRARRTDGRLVLAFVDVDGLKQLNDREGHAAGDALLVDVVATMRSKLRSYDPVVRFGGDEFICALSGADVDGARRRFEDIEGALCETREGCSISVGFAQMETGDTLDDLTSRGDAALYEAKRRKKGDRSAGGQVHATREK